MYMTSEIIKDILADSFQITEYGRPLHEIPLLLPAFYLSGTVPVTGGVYILRGSELPENLHTKCLYICFGTVPSNICRNCLSEILYLSGQSSDYLHIFNKVQNIYHTILQWENSMQDIMKHSCSMEEMVRVSIPIFENRITITDYNLNILACCEHFMINGKKESRISHSFEHVPHEKSTLFNTENRNMIFSHTPYHFKEQDTGTDHYCINLFLDKEYIGTCSLMENCRPIRKSDYLLFQKFAAFITAALKKQSSASNEKYVTLKTIFLQLLKSLPVSQKELTHALEMTYRSHDGLPKFDYWICLVLQSANRNKLLPESYLCSALERLLPHCTALSYEDELICILPVQDGTDQNETISQTLAPMLQDLNFRSGSSLPFQNIFKLRTAYQQALCAVKIGICKHPKRSCYVFQDYLLDYLLQNCCGSFKPEDLLPPELHQLHNPKGSVDYWDTLRNYLDHECNASETATSMFLHRSSLLPRLKKIQEHLDLESAETRLLLRILLHLHYADPKNNITPKETF